MVTFVLMRIRNDLNLKVINRKITTQVTLTMVCFVRALIQTQCKENPLKVLYTTKTK